MSVRNLILLSIVFASVQAFAVEPSALSPAAAHKLGHELQNAGNHAAAHDAFLSAANRGNASANFDLGKEFNAKAYVEPDKGKQKKLLDEAFNRFKKASDLGHGEATYYVGMYYKLGAKQVDGYIYQEHWNKLAYPYLKRAADAGFEPAKKEVATLEQQAVADNERVRKSEEKEWTEDDESLMQAMYAAPVKRLTPEEVKEMEAEAARKAAAARKKK